LQYLNLSQWKEDSAQDYKPSDELKLKRAIILKFSQLKEDILNYVFLNHRELSRKWVLQDLANNIIGPSLFKFFAQHIPNNITLKDFIKELRKRKMMNEDSYFDSLSFRCQKEGKNKIEAHDVYDIFDSIKGAVGIEQIPAIMRSTSFAELKNINKQVHQHSSLNKDEQQAVTDLVELKIKENEDLKEFYDKVFVCAQQLQNAS